MRFSVEVESDRVDERMGQGDVGLNRDNNGTHTQAKSRQFQRTVNRFVG